MKKKQMDQNGAPGIRDKPSGYATNARPGPEIYHKSVTPFLMKERDWCHFNCTEKARNQL